MDYLTLLEQGIDKWNQWRASHPNSACSLEGIDLSHGYLFEGNFQGVDLRGVNLQRACLVGANFKNADLTGADLSGAYLDDATFYGANLTNANLTKAVLERVDMRRANLLGTQFADVDLRTVKLPNPNTDPYSIDLSPRPSTLPKVTQPTVATSPKTVATAKHPTAKQLTNRHPTDRHLANKPSLISRMMAPLKPRSRNSPQASAESQQNIRLSAIPTRPTKKSSSRTQRFKAGKPKAAQQTKPQPQKKAAQPAKIAAQPVQTTKSTARAAKDTQWGRRQSDQRLAALLGHSVRQKQSWLPILATAGITVVMGLPFAIPTIVNSQQQLAAQAVTTLALTKSLTSTSQIRAIATHTPSHGNPQVIAGEANGNIQIWDGKTGETLQTLTSDGEGIQAIAISTTGQWLISSSREGLNVWNPNTGERIHTLPTSGETISAVAITPDESTFFSSDEAGNIAAWDIASGQQRYQVTSRDAVWDIAIAPDGQSFVSSSSNRIHQRDIATGKVLQTFTGHTDAVRSVAISPDGITLASGSQDQTIKLWNLATGDLQTTLSGHTDQIASLAISADGTTLASNSRDRTLKLWDLPSRQLTKTLDQDTNMAIAVAFANSDSPHSQPHNQILISGGNNQTINVWQ